MAFAEDGYNAQLFQPSIFGGNFIAIEDSHTLCFLGFGAGMYFNYANAPIQLEVGGEGQTGLVNQLLTTDFTAAFGPAKWLSLGLDVPVHLYTRGRTIDDIDNGDDISGLASDTQIGDIRVEAKFRALDQEENYFGMAVAPFMTFPTGDPAAFLGEGRATGGGILIVEYDFGVLNLAANGGYLYRGDIQIANTTVGDAWKLGAGISRSFDMGVEFSVEYWASWTDTGSMDRIPTNPMEIMGTFRYRFGRNLPRVIAGASGGLTEGIGCPGYRLVAGVDYSWCKPEADKGNLVVLTYDTNNTPLAAHLTVAGPNSASLTTDDTGRWESLVLAGNYFVEGSQKGYTTASATGTVTPENSTTIKVVLSKIPDTYLSIAVQDSCTHKKISAKLNTSGPSGDSSHQLSSGSFHETWATGNVKLTVGNPEYETKTVDVNVKNNQDNAVAISLHRKIKKTGKIFFMVNSSTISTKSFPVLDDVAAQIKELCDYNNLQIQGYTSSEGSDQYNMKLSERRADSVRKYLANKGVDLSKLQVKAFGETMPIATNDTNAGRSKNRRVEFVIK
jgi:outer membrane protein OmpA-like peptidoglycan-associated protein